MNREIKFRAWKDGMLSGFVILGTNQIAFTHLNELKTIVNDVVLMQFTGIKDKNGIELFEGDICKVEEWYPSDYKEAGFIGEIMFEDGSFFVYREVEKYPFYQELDSCSVSNRSIIKIGNKFENAELLLAVA